MVIADYFQGVSNCGYCFMPQNYLISKAAQAWNIAAAGTVSFLTTILISSIIGNMPAQTSSKTLSSQSSQLSSQSSEVELGFEALLKPLTYILSHVWDAALTQCLERYLNFLKLGSAHATLVNFKQAAILLQNSASYYCKRVDLVYSGCQEFVLTLQTMCYQVFGAETCPRPTKRHDKGETTEESDGPTKKRKVQKSFQSDSLEVLNFMSPDHNINVKAQNVDRSTDKKCYLLSKNVKAVRKPNTSCTVYQDNGKDMGYKEDFRINWPVNTKGSLNEEIVISIQSNTAFWGLVDDDTCYDEGISDVDGDMLVDDCATLGEMPGQDSIVSDGADLLDPPCPQSPSLSPLPTTVPEPERVASPRPVTNGSEPKDPYKKITFDFNIPIDEVKKRKIFKLPEEILSEVGDWKKRKRGEVDNQFALNHTKSFFSFLKHYGIQNFKNPECKIELSLTERRKLRMQRMKDRVKLLSRLASDHDEGFPGFGEDECFSPNDDAGGGYDSDVDGDDGGPESIDVGLVANLPQLASQQEESQTYEQDVVRTMTIYRENKLNQAKELSEIAKRVTAWQEGLQGMLAQAEHRSQFDIHEYGTEILAGFTEPETKSPVKKFSDIVRGRPKEEISRFLLSSLMLANTYNVELIQTEPGDLAKDCLSLRLLSRTRHHEEIDMNMMATSDGLRL